MYLSKRVYVEAIRWVGEPVADLPAWVRNSKVASPLNGELTVVNDYRLGRLFVPTSTGLSYAYPGDWLVYDNEKITAVSDKVFSSLYELAPHEDARNEDTSDISSQE